MTRSRRTAVRLSALGLVAAVALTGCGPFRPGAAAIVGEERITLVQVERLTTAARSDEAVGAIVSQDPAAFERAEVADLVRSRLLTLVAADLGITLDRSLVTQRRQEYVDQLGGESALLTSAAQAGLTPARLDVFLDNNVLQSQVQEALVADVEVPQAQLQQAYDENIAMYDKVTAAHILVADKATADAVLAAVTADPSTFAAQAAANSVDTATKDDGGSLGTFGKGEFATDFETPVFAAKVGELIEIQTQFGWHVVRIDAHETVSLADATPNLRLTLLADQAAAALSDALQKKAASVGVSVNPRFGSFDAASQQIVDGPRPAISPETGPAPGAPAASQG